MERLGEILDGSTLRFVRVLPGSLEDIWAMLVEPDKRALWLAGGQWELVPGGRAELVFNNQNLCDPGDPPELQEAERESEVRFVGRVVRIKAPRLIELAWPEDDGRESRVRFELAEEQGRVRLTLYQWGIDDIDFLRGTTVGWHTHLDILLALCANAVPPSFWSCHRAVEAAYQRMFDELRSSQGHR